MHPPEDTNPDQITCIYSHKWGCGCYKKNMKTNLSSCCNAGVNMSIGGDGSGHYWCTKGCGECNLASLELQNGTDTTTQNVSDGYSPEPIETNKDWEKKLREKIIKLLDEEWIDCPIVECEGGHRYCCAKGALKSIKYEILELIKE